MTEILFGMASAFWLGILTSISPCPMATNVTAISYVGRKITEPKKVFIAGLLYTIGRTLSYVVLGVLLVSSLLSAPFISHFLQKQMNLILGPILIITGMILAELLHFNLNSGVNQKVQNRLETMGMFGALLMGVVFALSFCPVSAALFFGSLIPVAIKFESGIALPMAYGIATGLPVLLFAILISVGAKRVGEAFNKLTSFERWARLATGYIFILVGIYYCLTHIFGF